jgi:hypothetical protein
MVVRFSTPLARATASSVVSCSVVKVSLTEGRVDDGAGVVLAEERLRLSPASSDTADCRLFAEVYVRSEQGLGLRR